MSAHTPGVRNDYYDPPEPTVIELRKAHAEVSKALWDCIVAMGRQGANHDLKHPLRLQWEAAVRAHEQWGEL